VRDEGLHAMAYNSRRAISPGRLEDAPSHDLIVMGASAGGVEALMRLMAALPADLPAAVCVVLHMPPQSSSHLAEILLRAGLLPVTQAQDGEPLARGHVYVAPPDRHLMVEAGRIRCTRGPRENRVRPAIDPLFRSAALAYGPRVIGVVLSGALDDGTAGLYAIKQRGGFAVVQDPADALIPNMPQSALEYIAVDYCVPVSEMGELLVRLAHEPATGAGVMAPSRDLLYEVNMAKLDAATLEDDDEQRPGTLSAFACPECKGPLWELHDGELLRYRCRVGHAYTGETVLESQSEALEDALRNAYNTLTESALVAERLAADVRGRGHTQVAQRLEERAAQQRRRAETVRKVIGQGDVADVSANA